MSAMLDVDLLARRLSEWGSEARRLPPGMWDHDGETIPLVNCDGGSIGRIIPGRGLLLDADLRSVGIRKPVCGVIERTTFMRALERYHDDRGAIASMAELQAAYDKTREEVCAYFASAPNVAAGIGMVNFGQDAFIATGGATTALTAAPGTAPTKSHAASYSAQFKDPAPGNTKYIASLGVTYRGTGASVGYSRMRLVDVLVECGTISIATTGVQTLNTTALTRYTSGGGVLLAVFGDIQSNAALASVSTFTVQYVDQSGNAATTTLLADTIGAGQTIFQSAGGSADAMFYPASGNWGFRSVTSIQSSVAATGTTPTVALMLFKTLMYVDAPSIQDYHLERDVRSEPYMLKALATTAGGVLGCLSTHVYSSGTSANSQIELSFSNFEG